MKVSELIEKLKQVDQDALVVINGCYDANGDADCRTISGGDWYLDSMNQLFIPLEY